MSDSCQGPLNGVRVVDVSIMAAGPWTGALLGMLGAEVIKVEPPAGDGTRWVMPTQRGMGTNYISMNVNKKDIVLDFKTEQGRELALDLAASSDVFIQNFRVGVIDRLGLDYESLRKLNPRLVYGAISGFGEIGPLAQAGCADPIMQAFSGFARTNGALGDALEAFRFTGFIDLVTASVATEAILVALLERESSGLGQKVEISMLEAALEIQFTRIAELLGAGVVPHPLGSESLGLAPDKAFRTKDQDIFVTVHNDKEWHDFCEGIDNVQLASDARFVTNLLRVARRDDLNALLEPIFLTKPAVWWLRVFKRKSIACGLAWQFDTFRHHRQIVENHMIANLVTGEWGEISVGGLPWHFSRTTCGVTPPPHPGEHTDMVLARLKQEQASKAITSLRGGS